MGLDRIDIFVVVSGTFSIVTAIPLVYLAVLSVRDARGLRRIQHELACLVRETKEIGEEVHRLQHELRSEQDAARSGIDETLRTVEQVTEAVGQVSEAVEQVVEVAVERRRPLLLRLLLLASDRK
jgi:uncharacterized protein YoxC